MRAKATICTICNQVVENGRCGCDVDRACELEEALDDLTENYRSAKEVFEVCLSCTPQGYTPRIGLDVGRWVIAKVLDGDAAQIHALANHLEKFLAER